MNSVLASNNGLGPAGWSLRLLGGFDLCVLPGGERVALAGKRERVLLAYLALSPNYRQPRRKLVTLLWGDTADENTLDNLRNCLWNLRKALGDTEHRVVASDGEDIVLDAAAFDGDALAFRQLAARSGRTELEAAVALYSGEFLDGLVIESDEFETWRRAEASRYRDQAVDVLTRLMMHLGECGETERAIEAGERILRLEPLHEAAIRRLMHHYGESGRRGAAIQLYRTFAEALRTELDAQPEAETRLALAQIAQGGEERATNLVGTNANPPLATMARRHNAPGELWWPPSGLRAPLAILAGALLVATALISYGPFAPLNPPDGIVTERATASDPASAIAIAVLPFLNLSGDTSQEFFSDGITEEITSALAMVRDLKVVARTSAFQFKGEKQDLRAVGRALNATHLVEGSVRKDGNRVRITAQLIEVGKGTHLWSENYDRQLSDIFATQEEIARTVVGSLMAPLGLALGETLVSNRTDLESYDQYLRAKSLVRARAEIPDDLIATLETLVRRDPNYAPAWALLSRVYALGNFNVNLRPDSIDESRRAFQSHDNDYQFELAARKAIQLDSRQASAYASLATVQYWRGKWAVAEDLYKQGLALDPNNPDILYGFSVLLRNVGRYKEGLSVSGRVRILEPLSTLYEVGFARALQISGKNQESIAILEAIPPNNYSRNIYLAQAYATAERYVEAADMLLAMPQGVFPRRSVEDAARLLRGAPAKIEPPEALPVLEGELNFVYAHVGAMSRVMEYPERNFEIGRMGDNVARTLWRPNYAPLRKTERFKEFVRKTGLVDYWRARGWPEFCRPMGVDDFVCV
jgi:adenylate cyclase